MTKGRDDDDGDDGIDDHVNESDGNTFALLPGHPKSASKRARVRIIRAVVDIVGPGLPSEDARRESSEKNTLFFMQAMIMFVPHRNSEDIKDEDGWETA